MYQKDKISMKITSEPHYCSGSHVQGQLLPFLQFEYICVQYVSWDDTNDKRRKCPESLSTTGYRVLWSLY